MDDARDKSLVGAVSVDGRAPDGGAPELEGSGSQLIGARTSNFNVTAVPAGLARREVPIWAALTAMALEFLRARSARPPTGPIWQCPMWLCQRVWGRCRSVGTV
jgi:hypothetical protein